MISFIGIIMVALAGCPSGKTMVPVKGKVTYKDGTVPQGAVAVVNFTPAENSTATVRKGATGAIGPDGMFEMVTFQPGDGVNLGTYDVSFTVRSNPMDPNTSLVAPKYDSPKMSGYTVDVDGPKDNLRFEIEKNQAPPIGGAPGE
jgi:hypothetical protein